MSTFDEGEIPGGTSGGWTRRLLCAAKVAGVIALVIGGVWLVHVFAEFATDLLLAWRR